MATVRPGVPPAAHPARWRVRGTHTLACVLSICVYLAFGIWPLLDWLFVDSKRRGLSDFCVDISMAGIAFTCCAVASSLFLSWSWIASLLVLRCIKQQESPPIGWCHRIPAIAHLACLVAEAGITVHATSLLWDGDSGNLCKIESEAFFERADLYVKVTYAMLTFQLFICIYLYKLWICWRCGDSTTLVYARVQEGSTVDPDATTGDPENIDAMI